MLNNTEKVAKKLKVPEDKASAIMARAIQHGTKASKKIKLDKVK